MSEESKKPEMTGEKAGEVMAAMWTEMSEIFRAGAVGAAREGEWRRALDLGRAADVATWQATGEGDCTFLKDLVE